MFKVKGQRSRSQRNVSYVTYQQGKRFKTATDRLSDFNFGKGDEIKADRDCEVWGCLKFNAFVIATLLLSFIAIVTFSTFYSSTIWFAG